MRILRFAALAAVTALALPASASAAKFNVFVQASQETTWTMDRQLDTSGCIWAEGRGRERARFAGAGVVFGTGTSTGARFTYGGLGGIPLRGISNRFNLTMTESEPSGGGTRCGPVSRRQRTPYTCGTRRDTVYGRLAWRANLLSLGLRGPGRLAFANCPVFTPSGVPTVGLGEVEQRVVNLLDQRYRRQTMQVRRTFRGTRRVLGRDIETISTVRWKLTFYRYGARR